ncbi:hypothetical protein K440DRAFT_412629 [Wilcoxina mikolae CBS 423.85]|nr:hypothetical protein K440DRAFT_412629 [Wilcoxina mikolae CBS 423.85]
MALALVSDTGSQNVTACSLEIQTDAPTPTRYDIGHKPSVDSLQLDPGLGNKRRISNSQEAPKAKRRRDSTKRPSVSHDTFCLRIARNGKFNDAENKKLIDHAKMIVDFLMHGDPTNYPKLCNSIFQWCRKKSSTASRQSSVT